MIRAVMITTLPPQKTGESPYSASLIQKLAETGNVVVTAITGAEAYSLPSQGGLVETLGIWNGRSLTYPFSLFRRVKKMRPHLVHVQFGPHGAVYGGMFGEVMIVLLLLLRFAGIKTTITLHSTWMTDQVVKRIRQYRIVNRFSILGPPLFKIYMRLLSWGTDVIQLSTVKVSSALRDRFLQEYQINPNKVVETPHPCRKVDTTMSLHDASETLGLVNRKAILVFGFIRPGKGLEIALNAMSIVKESVPSALLLIAGRPMDEDGKKYLLQLKEQSRNLNLQDNVRFDSKFISDEKLPAYFGASVVVLVPYTESVGASGPIHNYAGYGVPILASDAGYHLRESLNHSVVTFRSEDPEDLAEKLIHLLGNEDLRLELGQKIADYSKKETWSIAAKRTIIYYKKTINPS
jgi:glycosyltransferase involved in cell wall biosynthesis